MILEWSKVTGSDKKWAKKILKKILKIGTNGTGKWVVEVSSGAFGGTLLSKGCPHSFCGVSSLLSQQRSPQPLVQSALWYSGLYGTVGCLVQWGLWYATGGCLIEWTLRYSGHYRWLSLYWSQI